MLKPLIYKKKENSPEIILDKDNNIFKIEGRFILEDNHTFNKTILLWFEEYFKNPNKNTSLNLKLDYINSSSSIFLMKLIFLFEKNDKTQNLKIVWEYNKEDELIKARGTELKKVSEIEIELKEFTTNETETFDFNI